MERPLLFLVLSVALFSVTQAKPSLTAAVANQLFSLLKWTSTSPSKPPPIDSSVLQFESGYLVETIAEGNKLGMTPHSIRVSPEGELIAVDSINNNIVRITPPLSSYSRARLVAGSFQGQSGHIDGKPSEARFRNPRSVAMDRKGNIYVADTSNLAIRKIGESGVTTIAGGKSNSAGYRDGPSEDARFSSDFDLVYVASICSLIVVDRGNAALRQIFLQDDECSSQLSSVHSSDIIMVLGAVLAGYLSCLVQHGSLPSSLKKALTFGRKPRYPIAEKLKSEGGATWASCQRVFRNFCQFCVDFFPLRLKSKSAVVDQKLKGASPDAKQQKNLKAAVQREPAGPIKHRRRQDFADFYGLTQRHHEVRGLGSTPRPVEVNPADRKFEHFHPRSKYSSPDTRHQSRSGQRGE